MKKIVSIIIILISLFPLSGNAQFIKSFGFKFGVHFADQLWGYQNQYYDNFYKLPPNHRFFFEIGFFAEYFRHKFLSLITEINVNDKGSKVEYDQKDENGNVFGTASVYNKLNYASIIEKVKFRKGNTFGSVYCFIGPRLDLLRNSSYDQDFKDIYKNFKSSVWGATVGAGIEFKRFILEAQYDADFTNSFSSPSGNIRNSMISVRMGIKFGNMKYFN